MGDVTRAEYESLREDINEMREICIKIHRKLFETNGGPSVLDRLNHVESEQREMVARSQELRKLILGTCTTVVGSIIIQAIIWLLPKMAAVGVVQ